MFRNAWIFKLSQIRIVNFKSANCPQNTVKLNQMAQNNKMKILIIKFNKFEINKNLSHSCEYYSIMQLFDNLYERN